MSSNIFANTADDIMRETIRRFGQKTVVIMITLCAVLLSIVLTLLAAYNIEGQDLTVSLLLGVGIPGIITPLVAWMFIGLFARLESAEEKMRELATYDSMTGLLTRQAFYHHAQRYMHLIKREHGFFAVLIFDLDFFKKINDTYGHYAGDRVLEKFGAFLSEQLRKSDIVGRVGGEEFAAILPSVLADDALHVAEMIRSKFEKLPIYVSGEQIFLTVSIGVSVYTDTSMPSIGHLLSESDSALYHSKENGRNCITMYNPKGM